MRVVRIVQSSVRTKLFLFSNNFQMVSLSFLPSVFLFCFKAFTFFSHSIISSSPYMIYHNNNPLVLCCSLQQSKLVLLDSPPGELCETLPSSFQFVQGTEVSLAAHNCIPSTNKCNTVWGGQNGFLLIISELLIYRSHTWLTMEVNSACFFFSSASISSSSPNSISSSFGYYYITRCSLLRKKSLLTSGGSKRPSPMSSFLILVSRLSTWAAPVWTLSLGPWDLDEPPPLPPDTGSSRKACSQSVCQWCYYTTTYNTYTNLTHTFY